MLSVCVVELPLDDDGMEAGASSLLREHSGPEAGRADPPHLPLHGRADQRGTANVLQCTLVITH